MKIPYKFLITVLSQKDNIKLKEIENEKAVVVVATLLLSRAH